MKLTVAGLKIKITQAIEDHLHKKIEKSLKSLPESADVHVALTVEKYRHFAEVTVKDKGYTVHGESETDDLYTAMDEAVERAEKQLKKHKDRSKSLKLKQSVEEKDRQVD
ncbi:MAG: ribosome-associated translation inhibitor RaiA [Nitrospinota bacterium]|jgi:putative sigma-54 modulation protein|nr:ribosome-associated translation inhibitor RaiA [Nitrospinota bacterium]MDH5789577.1 ribosome-associated translation inhibitor RaiA [Nitrospinota bacterium]